MLCHESRVEIKKIWQKGNREKRGTSHRMKTWNWKTFTRSATVVHPGKITKSLSTVCPPGKTWQLWRLVTLEMLWLLFKNKISAEWINLDLSDELVSFTSDLSAIHVHWLWNWSNNWNCYLYLARLFLFMEYFFFLNSDEHSSAGVYHNGIPQTSFCWRSLLICIFTFLWIYKNVFPYERPNTEYHTKNTLNCHIHCKVHILGQNDRDECSNIVNLTINFCSNTN